VLLPDPDGGEGSDVEVPAAEAASAAIGSNSSTGVATGDA
jgi:hypothetical protein